MHGGVEKPDLQAENLAALEAGFANLDRHIANMGKFGLPVVVAVNRFRTDTPAEIELLQRLVGALGIDCVLAPSGHTIPVRDIRLSGGAEFVVAICGDILTMPGLPRMPAANNISVDAAGRITGLFLSRRIPPVSGALPVRPGALCRRLH